MLECLPDNVIQGTMDLEPDDPDNVKILSIKKAPEINKFAKLETPDPGCKNISLHTFLKKNIERQVMITTSKGNIVGRIKWIQEVDEVCDEDIFVIIETGDNNNKSDTVINISKIDEIHGIREMEQEDRDLIGSGIEISFQISGSSNSSAILSYLTYNHVIWVPSYHITINQDAKTLSLRGKVTFSCDPSFQKTSTIPEVILCAEKPDIEVNHSAFLKKSKEDEKEQNPKQDDFLNILEDEFEYRLENVELSHEQPTSVNFFEPLINIPYEDVYHIDVKWKPEVKKAISFKNMTDHHLTTGSVVIVTKSEANSDNVSKSTQKFLSQSKLRFTTKKNNVVIPYSQSIDVLAKVSADETEMKMEKILKDWIKNFEVKMKVELENTLNKMSKCFVETIFPGDVITSDPEVTYSRNSTMKKQFDFNAMTQNIWEVNVGPRQKTELNFRFLRKEIMLDDDKIPQIYL